jgi:hydrophobic/amphiphilic exporter-1 (mainly G- bacteria), HAE1 family
LKLAEFAIKRPVSLLMFYLAVVFLGFVSLRQLSVDLLPNINTPRLSVIARCPGVAPEEIETLVAMPLEAALSLIPGLHGVESVSREGVAYLMLEFGWGTNMDFAMLHTREKLDGARNSLPEAAENPTIVTLDPMGKPILVLSVSGDRGLLELTEFAEELVKPRLEQVEGLGSAEITGGVEREIRVQVNPGLLSLYGLTVDDVAARIDASNQSLQGGTIRKGKFKYALRIVGEFEAVPEMGEIGLKTTRERGVIRLKDVARIEDSVKERQGATRLDGRESIGILVRKEYGANTVKVTKLARAVIDQITKENPQVSIRVISEQSKYIEQAIGSVISEIVQGAILAFFILLLFLQEWKTPLIIDTVIPISVIATFNLLYFNNISLNVMSLGGLALGIGMLDDCAVVVSENIFRHRSLGKSLSEAAYVGTKEVGPAVTATALTTVIVFLPVIYVHGVAGQLFKDEALTVTFALMCSLLVSLTLLPMLHSRRFEVAAVGKDPGKAKSKGATPFAPEASPAPGVPGVPPARGAPAPRQGLRWFLRLIPRALSLALGFLFGTIVQAPAMILGCLNLPFRPIFNALFRGFNAVYSRFVEGYQRCLRWSLDHKSTVLTASIVFFAATFSLGYFLPRENMPKVPASSFDLFLKSPVDYSFEQTDALASSIEKSLRSDPHVRVTFSQVGIVSGMESLSPDVSVNSARIFAEVRKSSELEPLLESLRKRLAAVPGLSYSIAREQSTLAQFLSFSGSEIGLKVRGEDIVRLKEISEDLAGRLRSVRGIADINTTVGEGKSEFLVRLKKDALEKYTDVSSAGIGNFIVRAVRGRLAATQFRELEKKYDILVRLEAGTRLNIETLLDEPFPNQGSLIPLRELVTYELVRGPREIRRENQQRQVIVSASLNDTKISRVTPAIERKIAELNLPPDYQVTYGGEQEEMSKSFRSLVCALLLAVLLTYMIMAAQFESLLHPFLVMFTLPMGAAGSFFSLFVTGQTLNAVSIMGMVVLVGLVVDDAIVEIDTTNQLRRTGVGLRQAVEEACHVRLRPILMASLSTVFGVIPMALGIEKGAALLKPLGIVVLGGLLFSTFLTLIQIPVLYEWVEKRRGGGVR